MGSGYLGLHRLSILTHQQVVLPSCHKVLLKFHTLAAVGNVATVAPFTASFKRYDGCCLCSRACRSMSNLIIRCCSTNAFVIANDEKYGNKQIISINPHLYDYILANVREPEILRQLREETASLHGSQMQVMVLALLRAYHELVVDTLQLLSILSNVSPDQAQLLAMLVQILGAERCIEVGVYTGYSSLAVAMVLPDSGLLVACERDAKCLDVARKYYDLANVSHKVNIKHGLAADALKSMILNGEAGSYDFAFVDAEKRMYQEYYELLLQLVKVGGLIVIDNVLWHGKVADPMVNDAKTVSIRNFNKNIMEDQRVSISMVPIGDGMTICRKK
ncbi:uncharacterized protein LOC107423368 isoform X1 [Ziziphus jujuba]|uniref:Uncharacterized protein LOC107423368 isoform X1 n=1 Tax=Ziziphus jujuba TaxID=326968 RepID=A0ABM4A4N4_ZIZJJ|nr:uncharacterized protein LOC107423368 isoform X1 [Ziziphus jujuba]XP_060671695.1 uncharacterized protein LOC107423368 isoform X1 [Ziziphus jujuba]